MGKGQRQDLDNVSGSEMPKVMHGVPHGVRWRRDASSGGKKRRKWWKWLYCPVGKGLIKREERGGRKVRLDKPKKSKGVGGAKRLAVARANGRT